MTARRVSLYVEELSARTLPSAFPLFQTGDFAAAQHAQPQHSPVGLLHGQYTINPSNPDVGASYSIQGSGTVAGLGDVTVHGSLHAVGFIQGGRAGGTLKLTNVQGSATLQLQGPVQPAFSPLPEHFIYAVVGGTGAYPDLKDHGSLKLTLQPDTTGPLHQGLFPISHGTFKLIWDRPANVVSGIEGVALVGPIFPVDRPGVLNTRPLPGAVILVEAADTDTEVARVVADQNGRFRINLPPGRYRINPLPPSPGQLFPRGTPQTLVVAAGHYSNITLSYDSGIR